MRGSIMSGREIQDQKAIAVRCLFNKLLTLMRTFRLARRRGIRFAPSRLTGLHS